MMQLDKLYDFMQADMEAERYEGGMRNSPNRLKLNKQKEFLLEQQNEMKKLEVAVSVMADRMEAIQDEADRLRNLLGKLTDELKEHPPETLEEIQKQLAAAKKLEETLTQYEQELSRMRKESEQFDASQLRIRTRAASTKAEYDKLRSVYLVEFEEAKTKLEQMKAKAEEMSRGIPADLMSRYRQVKQHVLPPMARVNGDRCGGCNMSLPVATRSHLSSSADIVTCDNCGRILFIPDGTKA